MRWSKLKEVSGLNPLTDVELSDFAEQMRDLRKFAADLAATADRKRKPISRYQDAFDDRAAETSEIVSMMLDAWQPETRAH